MFNERMNEMQRTKELAFVFETPLSPQPPYVDLHVMDNEIEIIQAIFIELWPPPKLSHENLHTQVFSNSYVQGRKDGFHGLLNVVFDRGMFQCQEMQYLNLEVQAVFQGVGIVRNLFWA